MCVSLMPLGVLDCNVKELKTTVSLFLLLIAALKFFRQNNEILSYLFKFAPTVSAPFRVGARLKLF